MIKWNNFEQKEEYSFFFVKLTKLKKLYKIEKIVARMLNKKQFFSFL